MSARRFRNRPCVYCTDPAVTGDHVIARKLFFVEDRANLPQVPVCERCNDEKGQLERYMLIALPMGNINREGKRYFHELLKRRLEKDRALARKMTRVYAPGFVVNSEG